MTHNEKNNQLIEIDQEQTEMLELARKDIKIDVINVFHMFKKLNVIVCIHISYSFCFSGTLNNTDGKQKILLYIY